MAYQTFHLFGLEFSIAFLFFVGAGTLCSYNFHWYLTSPDDKKLSVKNAWNLRHRRLHLLLAGAAFVAALIFFLQLKQHYVWLAAAVVVAFLYSAPKIPFKTTAWLRKIAYGKTLFLALAWTYITAILPLVMAVGIWKSEYYIFCINRFFLIYAICILFDLRDRERDREDGIRSLVTLLDLSAVNRLYGCVVVVFFISNVLLSAYFPFHVTAAFFIPGLCIAVFYNWFRKQQSDLVYYFILDGLMAFSLPLLLIFEF